jgi:hypothetical protein
MIELKVNKTICKLDAEGSAEEITAEIIMAHVCLTKLLLRQADIKPTRESFAAAAMQITQQAALANKQAMDVIEKMQDGNSE